MRAPYGEIVEEHWRRPRNQGALEAPDRAHEQVNPLCGDRIRLELQLDGGRIAASRFRGEACRVATAAASLLTEAVQGMTEAQAASFSREQLLPLLGTTLRPARVACALLPLQALHAGLAPRP